HGRNSFVKRRVLRWPARRAVEEDVKFIDMGYDIWESTDCDQGNRLVAFIVPLPHRVRIEGGHPVHEELVLMVAMGKLDPNDPAAVRHARHRMGVGLPAVEVTNKRDALGPRPPAEEVHQVEDAALGVPERRY